jgi:UDP-glucose 4-epimerase
MRILVTGSSGTIGTRICETLLGKGYEVFGIDWVPNKWQDSVQKITSLIDMRDSDALSKWNPDVDIDVIIHLAANARVYELVEDPVRACDNMVTTFNALEFARTRGIKKFVFASSREVYGNNRSKVLTEDLVKIDRCESPYTASKMAGEALVHSYTRCYKIDHIIFRFSNVYGMYDDSERVVPLFIRRCKANEALTVFGDQKCLDFTYIDDTVDGIIKAVEKFDDAKNDTYNLAYGEGTTIMSLAERIKKLLGSTSEIVVGKPRTGEIVRYVADTSKARKTFGYDPKTPFSEGVEKAVEWYGKHAVS